MKKYINSILSIILIISFFIISNYKTEAAQLKSVIVYYFHHTQRCAECLKIEDWTREVVEKNFKKDLKAGHIAFQSINIDIDAAKHFEEEYKLDTQALILSLRVNGEEYTWTNVEDIWNLLNNKDKFTSKVTSEIKKIMATKLKKITNFFH